MGKKKVNEDDKVPLSASIFLPDPPWDLRPAVKD